MGARGLPIRDDLSPIELRRLARREPDRAASRRMYGIANALEGMSRAEAARLAGMERQALRDAVVRYDAEGLAGLHNRRAPARSGKLSGAELQELSDIILAGPDPDADGLSAWTLPELCRVIEKRFNKRLHPASLSRVLRRAGFSRQKARQRHPRSDKAAQDAFQKGGFWPRSTLRGTHILTGASACGARTRRASAKRVASAIAGGAAASARPAYATGAIPGSICSPRSVRPAANGSRWLCPRSRPRR